MGSGGGFFDDQGDAKTILERIAASRSDTERETYAAECAALFGEYLAAFNDRDTDANRRVLDEVADAIGAELDGTIRLRFGGSVAKRTYVEGLSDIDALVMLENCELAEREPSEAKAYLAERMRRRFPGAEVVTGELAVTLRLGGREFQFLPAVACRGHLQIADRRGEGWSRIKPREFSALLSRVNNECGRKLVPMIKLAKAIVTTLAERQQISGYHAESLAVALFRGSAGPFETRAMLRSFFERGTQAVLEPIRDRTGQSVHVDDYLGTARSLERRIVSDAFDRIARRIRTADLALEAGDWRRILEGDS